MALNKTPKSLLHELLAINSCPEAPIFVTRKIGGADHLPVFECTVAIGGWSWLQRRVPALTATGVGKSKKEAEHRAAVNVLSQCRDHGHLAWPDLTLPSKAPVFVF